MDLENEGLTIYDHIVNSEKDAPEVLPELVEKLADVDDSGQYLCSSARYLHAVDCDRYSSIVNRLVGLAIERDRERKYIGSLLKALWGENYMEHAEELRQRDDNFRRIFKRIYQ